MNRIETGGDVSPNRLQRPVRTEVAALSANLAGLSERKTAQRETTPTREQPSAKPRRSQPHGWLWWVCHSLVWAVTLSLAIAALLRIFFHDGTLFLCWINAFTRYVYLPAYLALAWAVWQRRWKLALAALAIVGGHVAWMAPDFLRDRRFDVRADIAAASLDASPTARVVFANVLGNNRDYEPLWKEISDANPDVLVLAECTYYCLKSLRESPLMTAYLRSNPQSQSQWGEVAVFSKLPIKAEVQNLVAGRIVRTVDVKLGSQTLRLIGLHGPRPMSLPGYDFYGYWDQMIPFLTTVSGPLVIVGDFNATEHSLAYRQLRAAGLRSAHDDRGRGYATTWPNGRYWVPPIRIDHAFLSPDVACTAIREGQGQESDHKPLIVDVHLRQTPRRQSGSAPPAPH